MEEFFTDNCRKNFNILRTYTKNGKFKKINQLIIETEKIISYEIELSLLDISFSLLGKVVPKSGGFIIYLNRNMDDNLYRFVLGHEIGHVLNSFEYERPWPIDLSHFIEKEEKICDYISLELTNPDLKFLKNAEKFQKLSGRNLVDELILEEYIKRNKLRM